MPDPFLSIAFELGYKKAGRLSSLPAEERFEAINFALKESIKNTYALLFLPHSMIQITPYGSSYAVVMPREGRNHYLTAHPKLNEEYFRQIFTATEMMIFKICHIYFEEQKSTYKFDKEGIRRRIKRLKGVIPVYDWDTYINLFEEVWFVRDAFAHTFIDLDQVEFKGISLKHCFGTTWTGGRHNEVEFTFVEDFETIFDPIMSTFVQRQKEQIDSEKFFSICDSILAPRTLGR